MQAPELLGGRYELRGILGRGGMAEVRDGWDIRLHRPVAIKLLRPAFSVQPDDRRRFEMEARAAAGLNHPHIVAVHDSGEVAGAPFIVMERLSGQTFADVMAAGALPQAQVRSILDDVLSALATAHAAGILHRDIKPENILFTSSGEVKVADFGIAKSAGSPATMTGQIVGTMAYLSPDRLMGRPATVGDDLYAVGVVGYEALSGRKPFPHDGLATLARAIAEDVPPPLALLRPDVEPGFAATIERAMAREPQWRFPNAEAMRDALSVAPQPNTVRPVTRILTAPLPPVAMAAAAPARSMRGRKLLAVAALLAVIALTATLLLVKSWSQPSTPEPAATSTVPTPTTSLLPPPPPPPPPPLPIDREPPGRKKPHGHKGGD
jgi:eukaryotic-like serine/threonine-protein kinase